MKLFLKHHYLGIFSDLTALKAKCEEPNKETVQPALRRPAEPGRLLKMGVDSGIGQVPS